MKTRLILSCEHAVNTIPAEYQPLFEQQLPLLNTHVAYDFGALTIAQYMSQAFDSPLIQATASRLVIDCNRSLHHLQCFSAFTKPLPHDEKMRIIEHYYKPYRFAVENLIQESIDQGSQVIHLSIHSFTHIWNEQPRHADIGLLYDPKRLGEKKLATDWRQRMLDVNRNYRIRMNYPYRGNADGFTSSLRKRHPEHQYLGFEVESSLALVQYPSDLNQLIEVFIKTFRHQ